MKNIFFCCVLVFVASLVSAQVQNYKVNPDQCSLTFHVSAQIHKVNGSGNEFRGTISGDPKDITTAKITIRLDPKNFNTENEKRDQVMREESLELQKYPFIEFESTSIEAATKELKVNEPLEATIQGVLKLHGIEKEIAVPVRILWDDHQIAADAEMDLNLDEFKIHRPKVLFFRLQKEVKVNFRIVAERQLEPTTATEL
jgi:polyisoprenoid-binding protein YceI